MNAVLARTLSVLGLWGSAFAAAAGAGASVRAAELAAMCGAGVTLVAWGLAEALLPARLRRAPAAPPVPADARQRDAG